MSAMKQASMHVNSLVLDESNPRHEKKTASLEESIAALLGHNPEKLYRLAKDIAQHGINPAELPIVVIEGDRNIVVEGNRRVAALKLLGNPSLAPTEKLQKQFAAIARNNAIPRRVGCVIAESRTQAEHWIMLRHDGEKQGVGIVPWSSAEKSRFSGRSTPTGKALLFIEAVSKWFADDPNLVKDAHTVRNSRITNLGRMLADPYVRNRLGLTFEGDVILRGFSLEKMKPVLARLFSDLAGSVTVDQIKSKEQRKDYLQQVEDDLPRLADRLEVPQVYSKNGAADDPSISTQAALDDSIPDTKPAKRRRADFDKKLFQGVALRHVSLRTSEVLEEAKQLKIDEMPNVAAIMVRAVVDIVATEVAEKLGWRRNQDTLKGRIGAVLAQVDPTKNNPALANAWRFSQQDDGALVLKTLHSFVHTWQSSPLSSEVRKLSMAYGPLLILADELLEKKGR